MGQEIVIIKEAQQALRVDEPQNEQGFADPKIVRWNNHKIVTIGFIAAGSILAATSVVVTAIFFSYIAAALAATTLVALILAGIVASRVDVSKELLVLIGKMSAKILKQHDQNIKLNKQVLDVPGNQKLLGLQQIEISRLKKELEALKPGEAKEVVIKPEEVIQKEQPKPKEKLPEIKKKEELSQPKEIILRGINILEVRQQEEDEDIIEEDILEEDMPKEEPKEQFPEIKKEVLQQPEEKQNSSENQINAPEDKTKEPIPYQQQQQKNPVIEKPAVAQKIASPNAIKKSPFGRKSHQKNFLKLTLIHQNQKRQLKSFKTKSINLKKSFWTMN